MNNRIGQAMNDTFGPQQPLKTYSIPRDEQEFAQRELNALRRDDSLRDYLERSASHTPTKPPVVVVIDLSTRAGEQVAQLCKCGHRDDGIYRAFLSPDMIGNALFETRRSSQQDFQELLESCPEGMFNVVIVTETNTAFGAV